MARAVSRGVCAQDSNAGKKKSNPGEERPVYLLRNTIFERRPQIGNPDGGGGNEGRDSGK